MLRGIAGAIRIHSCDRINPSYNLLYITPSSSHNNKWMDTWIYQQFAFKCRDCTICEICWRAKPIWFHSNIISRIFPFKFVKFYPWLYPVIHMMIHTMKRQMMWTVIEINEKSLKYTATVQYTNLSKQIALHCHIIAAAGGVHYY